MMPVLAIARSTMVELRRQRLLIVPIIGVVLSLLVLAAGLLLSDSDPELERRSAEAAVWAVGAGAGLAAAVYALIVGSSLVSRELSDGTMLMLAARPIGRWQVVLGRVVGAAAFLLLALAATCLTYGVVAMLLSGSTAPLEEPFEALWYCAPGVLLALCVGTAFSVQGRTTAAIGSAVIVSVFATGLAAYVDSWRTENHRRSYLTDEARDQLDPNAPVIGGISAGIVRLMPYGVFAANAAEHAVEATVGSSYDDGGAGVGEVDVLAVAQACSAEMREITDQDRDECLEEERDRATSCAKFGGGSSCFMGVRDAWTERRIPARPQLYGGFELLVAWLAIPAWIGIAVLLLSRRRDLA